LNPLDDMNRMNVVVEGCRLTESLYHLIPFGCVSADVKSLLLEWSVLPERGHFFHLLVVGVIIVCDVVDVVVDVVLVLVLVLVDGKRFPVIRRRVVGRITS